MADSSSHILAGFEQTATAHDQVVWDLRGGEGGKTCLVEPQQGFGKVLLSGDDVRLFLSGRAAAREQADVIVLGLENGEGSPAPEMYQQVMFNGLLKPGGCLVLEAAAEKSDSSSHAAAVLKMITTDLEAGVLLARPGLERSGSLVVELSRSWSAGMPTPSMCTPMESEEKDTGLIRRKPQASEPHQAAAPVPAAEAAPAPAPRGTFAARARTVLAILYLWACAPLLLLWALAAWARHRLFGPSFTRGAPSRQLRVLVTGGKMSKASAVARAVGRDGHKVFTAEILPYRYCHTRYCAYVSKHYVLPRPTVQPKEWEAAIQAIVAEQGIDLIIPCTAPVESSAYAHLRKVLPPHVRVFAFDGDTSDELDNKYTFNQVLVKAGLRCPETANMECTEDAMEFFRQKQVAGNDGKRYIVKPSVYDPKARTEILFLPISDAEKQLEYLRSRNASKAVPYVIQEVLQAPEYGSFAMFNKGALTGFEFFESAASCLVYKQVKGKHYDAVLSLNQGLGKAMNLTGQLTLDLMHTAAGDLVPIECNPRIHSAVCTLEGHRNIGAAFTDPEHVPRGQADIVTSQPETFRYWVMDQLFLMAGFWKPKSCFKLSLAEMAGGTDAILAGDDPMPFLAMYLVQIPSLLLLEILPGTPWLKVDFCIGKIVKEGGD